MDRLRFELFNANYTVLYLCTAGWCSWLSRFLNTEEVLGSNPSLVTFVLDL